MSKVFPFFPTRLRVPNAMRLSILSVLSVSLLGVQGVEAQTKNVNSTPTRYVVGADDVLSVTVLKHPEFSVSNVIVPQNGLLSLPVVGTLRANGKTLEQLDAEITKGLRAKLRSPEVTITLEKPRPRPLYVAGQVKTPGIYEVKNGWRITQALAAAGGLSVDADLSAVIVTRNNKKLVDTSLLPLLKDPANARNLVLKSGDSVRFYERKVTVSVTGAVTRPGPYSIPTGSGIVQAIGFAGGSTPEAALTRASVRRANGKIVLVNLYKALLQGDADSNIALVEGDVIVVPEQKERISVLGAVTKPGFFPMEDGRDLKVSDAIALAGGPLPNASLTRAVVRHADKTEQNINLYDVLVNGVQTDNVLIRPDDIISIPEARGITVIGEVTSPGKYFLEEGKTPQVSDGLAASGGLKIKPELARISVSRKLANGKSFTLDVDAVGLLELSDLSQNARLRDGDTISVSAIKLKKVSILGEVKTPGTYELSEDDGLVALIARAGGPTPDAALSKVKVTRSNGPTTFFNAVPALLEDGGGAGAPLVNGDKVVLLRSDQRVLIVGAVTNPGSYALPENRVATIGDALSLAGGPQSNARVKTVTLLRSPGPNQPATKTVLSLDKPGEDGKLALNQPILSGDVLYAPEGKIRTSTLDSIARFLPSALLLVR